MTDASLSGRAIAAYKASNFLDQRPVSVLSALHDELYRALTSAGSAYERGALDQMCRSNERATQILQGLIAALRPSSPPEEGQIHLQQFYRRLLRAVNSMLTETSATKTLQESLVSLRSMCQSFRERIK